MLQLRFKLRRMANVVIAQIVENTIVIWTDADPANPNYSRRNFIEIGPQCLVLHDDFLPWLPIVQPLAADPTINTLPVDELANSVSSRLRGLPNAPQNPVGLIIAGFVSSGGPAIIGLHSANGFAPTRFPRTVSAGLPASIWNYLAAVLQTIPATRDNAIDMGLIAGLVYHSVVFSQADLPAGSATLIQSAGQNPYWIPDGEIMLRQAHNNRRLQALQGNLINQLQRLSQ